MEVFDLYKDIEARTNGEIYLGVVGPVRTGKSTFIKRFMDLLVLPRITNEHSRQRTRDELPQSASGRTIMTTEPKFVPNEAVEVTLDNVKEVYEINVDSLYEGTLTLLAKGDEQNFNVQPKAEKESEYGGT